MNIPEDLKYTKEHEWVRIENDSAVIGITDFAQSELGDIIFIEYPEVGQEIQAGDPMGTIEAVKTVTDLFAPVSGIVTAVNEALEDSPDLVNTDPYNQGWMVAIKVSSDAGDLLTAVEYQALLDD
ncbi:MAG: glycine cleavage system protein GcvH [Fidelibacterota bacterium]